MGSPDVPELAASVHTPLGFLFLGQPAEHRAASRCDNGQVASRKLHGVGVSDLHEAALAGPVHLHAFVRNALGKLAIGNSLLIGGLECNRVAPGRLDVLNKLGKRDEARGIVEGIRFAERAWLAERLSFGATLARMHGTMAADGTGANALAFAPALPRMRLGRLPVAHRAPPPQPCDPSSLPRPSS